MSRLLTTGVIQQSSNSVGFDQDYQLVLDYAISQGYTLPSSAQQTVQNDLVIAVKASGAWDLLDVMYVFKSTGDTNFKKINWKTAGASNNAIEVGTMTWSDTLGALGTGTSGNYINTPNMTTLSNYSLNSAHRTIYLSKEVTNNKSNVGGLPKSSFAETFNVAGSLQSRINQGSSNTTNIGTVLTNTVGLKTLDRVSASNVQHYNNSSNVGGTSSTSSQSVQNDPFSLFRANNDYTNAAIAFFSTGSKIGGVYSDYYTAITNYISLV